MAKPKPLGEVDPRQILPGHFIQPKNGEDPEVVRSVSVVLHLANGFDEVYETDEKVKIMPPPAPPEPLPDNLMPVAPPEGE